MHEPLQEIITPKIRQSIINQTRHNLSKRRVVRKHGGAHVIARNCAREFIKALRNVSLPRAGQKLMFADPYILSFCSHADDDDYVKNNGLLSQWRGYGGQAGYAIIFDCKEMAKRVQMEAEKYDYSLMYMGDVVYENQKELFYKEFNELIQKIEEVAGQLMISDRKDEDIKRYIGELYDPYITAAARFKHQAFFEEREVRVVASPQRQEIVDYIMEKTGRSIVNKGLKDIRIRQCGVRYIELFRTEARIRLPIKKIIVGPGEDKEVAAEKAAALVAGSSIEISCSATPYY